MSLLDIATGLTEGIKTGTQSYTQARQMKMEEDALKKREEQAAKQFGADLYSKGLQEKVGGGFEQRPDYVDQEKAKLEFEQKKQEAELGILNKKGGLLDQELSLAKQQQMSKAKGLDENTLKAASDLRKELSGRPTSKDTENVNAAYRKIINAAKTPSAAGDVALVFNFMKMVDPGSTVREGEFATAQNSAGVPDRLRAQYNSVINGERLAEAQRADFVSQAGGQYKAQVAAQKNLDSYYNKLAAQYGIDPALVINQGLGEGIDDELAQIPGAGGKLNAQGLLIPGANAAPPPVDYNKMSEAELAKELERRNIK